MRKIILDTNAYSSFLSGDEKILEVLAKAEIIYMSIFVLAELYYGFKGGKKEEWNKEILEKFLQKPGLDIINGSIETSMFFSEIKYNLKKKGKPIPINDIWIASHAMETGSTLITYDNHFRKVPGLRLWNT